MRWTIEKAEAGAASEPAAERLKDPVEIFRRDADTFVAHRDREVRILGVFVVSRDGHPEHAAVGHRPERVRREIPDDLPDLRLVRQAHDRVARYVDDDVVRRQPLGAVLQQRRGVGNGPADVHRRGGMTLRPGVGEKAANRIVQPIRLADHDVHQLRLIAGQRQLVAQNLNRPRHRRQRVADLVRDARGHLSDGGEALLHARFALPPPCIGDVTEREDEPGLARTEGQSRRMRGAQPELDAPAVGPRQLEFDAWKRALVGLSIEKAVEAVGPLQHVCDRLTDGTGGRHTGDRFRRAIERDDPPLQIGRRQPARKTVDDVLAESLEIGDLIRCLLQLRARAAEPFGQIAAQRRHREEPEHVEAHAEERNPPRRQQIQLGDDRRRRDTRYCASTRPMYIPALSTPTMIPPRRDRIVLAAMIGSV